MKNKIWSTVEGSWAALGQKILQTGVETHIGEYVISLALDLILLHRIFLKLRQGLQMHSLHLNT